MVNSYGFGFCWILSKADKHRKVDGRFRSKLASFLFVWYISAAMMNTPFLDDYFCLTNSFHKLQAFCFSSWIYLPLKTEFCGRNINWLKFSQSICAGRYRGSLFVISQLKPVHLFHCYKPLVLCVSLCWRRACQVWKGWDPVFPFVAALKLFSLIFLFLCLPLLS